MLQLSLLLDAQDKLGMLVLSDRVLDLGNSHAGDINVPAIDIVALGQRVHHTSIDGIAVHDLNFGESNALFKP